MAVNRRAYILAAVEMPIGDAGTSTEAVRTADITLDAELEVALEDLDYMHARHCSPWLGRFLSVDLALGGRECPETEDTPTVESDPGRASRPQSRFCREESGASKAPGQRLRRVERFVPNGS